MVFEHLKSGLDVNDQEFDSIYPREIKTASEIHFTPVEVTKIAARFLVGKPRAKVLDVGSGAGKFCMIGAVCTDGLFTGVEQRESLHLVSQQLAGRYKCPNATFIHSNILEINFQQFDAIYFFNSFLENIFQANPIDESVALDKSLYAVYTSYMKQQLDSMPAGTRLATYFSFMDEIPKSYAIQSTHFDSKLKLWVKTI